MLAELPTFDSLFAAIRQQSVDSISLVFVRRAGHCVMNCDTSVLSPKARAFSVTALLAESGSPSRCGDGEEESGLDARGQRVPNSSWLTGQAPSYCRPVLPTRLSCCWGCDPVNYGESSSPALQVGAGVVPHPRISLESKELWQSFHAIGTEMVITKAGR